MPDWTFEGVVESAIRTTGLSDFGGTEHEEGLRLLVDDYRSRAGLTEVGSKRTRGALTQHRVKRLLIEHGAEVIPSPQSKAAYDETCATIAVPDMAHADKLAAALREMDGIETAYAKPAEELP